MTSIQSDAIRVRFCSHLLDNLLCRNGCKSVICRETEIRSLASLPTFAAFAQKTGSQPRASALFKLRNLVCACSECLLSVPLGVGRM